MDHENPFKVHQPEELTPEIIAATFVEMYTDFPRLKDPVNLFLHGARGTGKSMMLRSLEPSVQALISPHKDTNALPFYAVLVPIKKSIFANPELGRLKGWTATSVAEHLMTVYCCMWAFNSLSMNRSDTPTDVQQSIYNFFCEALTECGGQPSQSAEVETEKFDALKNICRREINRSHQFYLRLQSDSEGILYDGALTGLTSVLGPLIETLQKHRVLADIPMCVMIDDADNLPPAFQRVLNSWISMRMGRQICIKASTQLGYTNLRTVDDRIIESPHDFSEVNVGTVYTSNKNAFSKRMRAIVKRRLENANIEASPEEYFPCDAKQAERVAELRKLIASGETEGILSLKGEGASRARDNAARYAIPAFMRELARGEVRLSHTFSYAGFRSMTDLSAGVVRWFLEPATEMFSRSKSMLNDGSVPQHVSVSVQDEVLRDWSKQFYDKLSSDPGEALNDLSNMSLHAFGHTPEHYRSLRNLLDGVGKLCRRRTLDMEASEQRVFSFVLSDEPPETLQQVLDLGTRLGFLQKADYAAKSVLGGRRPRYILSRRLGPHYNLDVSGYAAHLAVTSSVLEIALCDPVGFVRKRLKMDQERDVAQGQLFK